MFNIITLYDFEAIWYKIAEKGRRLIMLINSEVQEVLNEIRENFITLRDANIAIEKNLEKLSYIDFEPAISPSFIIVIKNAARFFKTSFQSLAIIGFELSSGIQTMQQCDLLTSISKEADNLETALGEIWNTFWDEKPYENEDFQLVADLYAYGFDAARQLSFLDSISNNLSDLQ